MKRMAQTRAAAANLDSFNPVPNCADGSGPASCGQYALMPGSLTGLLLLVGMRLPSGKKRPHPALSQRERGADRVLARDAVLRAG